MKRMILQFLFCLLGLHQLAGQSISRVAASDDLSNQCILSMCQDSKGLLWLGTCDGLAEYNSARIRSYVGYDEIRGNLFEEILETDDNDLWLQTSHGLNQLDASRNLKAYYPQFQGSQIIKRDSRNNVYVMSGNTLYYKVAHSGNFLTAEGLLFDQFKNFSIDSKGSLWIFRTDGVVQSYRITPKAEEELTFSFTDSLRYDRPLFCVISKGDNAFLIDRDYNFYEQRLDEGSVKLVGNLRKQMQSLGEVYDIIRHRDKYFISFKTNGLLIVRPEEDGNVDVQWKDMGLGVFCLLSDRYQDIVWIGTDGQGLYRYAEEEYVLASKTHASSRHMISRPIRSIYLDDEKTLWLGTKGDGILCIPHYGSLSAYNTFDAFRFHEQNSALPDNSVYAIVPDRDRNLCWIGTDKGLCYYSYTDRRLHRFPSADGVEYVHAIYKENNTTLWIASGGKGIFRLTLKGGNHPVVDEVRNFTLHGGELTANYFFSLASDMENRQVWFGNRGYGAYSISTDSCRLVPFRLLNEYGNPLVNDVYSILKEKDTLYLGTSYGVIVRTAEGEQCYNRMQGFPNNTIHSMLKGKGDDLWLATNQGLVRLNLRTGYSQVYDRSTGLDVTEFSDGACWKHDDVLFFGGTNGVVEVRHNTALAGRTDNAYLPVLRLDGLSVLGREENIHNYLTDGNTLTLKHDENHFGISFIAMDYLNGRNYNYHYKIRSHGSQWIDNGRSGLISFTQMPPGDYELQVKYVDTTNRYESVPYTLELNILPPWYLSPLAYLVYVLLFLLAVFLTVRHFVLRFRRRRRYMLAMLENRHKEEMYEEKLRFFTNITHEFCTPLTLINGPCERILEHENTDEHVRKYVKLIKSNAERLNATIQEVIDFRRMETGHKVLELRQICITEMVTDICQSFSELVDRNGIRFSTQVEDSLFWVTDRNCFNKILTNLVSNAFKYTPHGGEIRITVSHTADVLRLSVYNTGKGIRMEDRERIFNRYSLLDNIEENAIRGLSSRNGLGMAICHSMVEQLQGKIEIDSTPGSYADMIVTLPLLEKNTDADAASGQPQSSEQRQAGKPFDATLAQRLRSEKTAPDAKVLVIDDNPELCWFIRDILSPQYEVQTVTDAKLGLEMLQRDTPDLIITDVIMAGVDGIQLTRKIKQNKYLSHIPLVILSAKNAIEAQVEGINSGADAYITKPFDVAYLQSIVARLIENRRQLNDYYHSSASAYGFEGGNLVKKEDKEFLQSVNRFIAGNIEDTELAPEDLAREMQMSVRTLYRRFKELDQLSPKDFIRDYRLKYSAYLLKTTHLTIQEVLYRSGFNNRSHYYREFNKLFGMTPKEYRNREKDEEDA